MSGGATDSIVEKCDLFPGLVITSCGFASVTTDEEDGRPREY
jgi:hypothetical protein